MIHKLSLLCSKASTLSASPNLLLGCQGPHPCEDVATRQVCTSWKSDVIGRCSVILIKYVTGLVFLFIM